MNDSIIDVYAVGSQVGLKIASIGPAVDGSVKTLGIVVGVRLRRDGVSYEVAYWHDGVRRVAEVTDDEVHPHKEAKPAKIRTKKATVPA